MNTNSSSCQPRAHTGIEPSQKRPPAPTAIRWLLALGLIYTLYFAGSLLVPILVALLLALLLSPIVAVLKRLYIPRTLSAILLLCAIGAPLSLLTAELAQPAQKWAQRLPELSAFMSETLADLTENSVTLTDTTTAPQEETQDPGFWGRLFGQDPIEKPEPPKTGGEIVSNKLMESGMEVALALLIATPLVIAQLMTCLMLFLFLLIFGPTLFEVVTDVVAQGKNKRRTIVLVARLRRHLSRYIVTVSLINIGLGTITTLTLWQLGVEDALLWGVLAAVLNFAPYLGPLLLVCILSLAGLAQYGSELIALMPALAYLLLNLIEAQLITPLVLGRNMRLNPLVVMLWLITWGWLWGASGVLLAVPLLVCIKLIADSLSLAPGWVRIMESKA